MHYIELSGMCPKQTTLAIDFSILIQIHTGSPKSLGAIASSPNHFLTSLPR